MSPTRPALRTGQATAMPSVHMTSSSSTGRPTAFPQHTQYIPVKQKDLRDVKAWSAETMPVEIDMMEFAIRMAVTSTPGEWETKPFMDPAQILRLIQRRR